MATISISGKPGNYAARFFYYDIYHKRKSKYQSGFTTKREAETWGYLKKQELEHRRLDTSSSIDDIIQAVLKEKELQGIAFNTMRKYKTYCDYVKNHFGKTDINDIQKSHIIDFLDIIKYKEFKNKKVYAPEKAKYMKKVLSIIWNYALNEGITTYNPLHHIKLPKTNLEYTTYKIDESKELILKIKEKNNALYPAVLLALFCGLRRGEICALRKEHIQDNIAIIKYSAFYHRDLKTIVEKDVKTTSSRRMLPLPEKLLKELDYYQYHNNIQSNYVVCRADGGQYNPEHITANFKKFLINNKLKRIKFHELRHTFSMLSLENKTDLDTLKRSLGHSSVNITSGVYLHDNLDLISKQINKICSIL